MKNGPSHVTIHEMCEVREYSERSVFLATGFYPRPQAPLKCGNSENTIGEAHINNIYSLKCGFIQLRWILKHYSVFAPKWMSLNKWSPNAAVVFAIINTEFK